MKPGAFFQGISVLLFTVLLTSTANALSRPPDVVTSNEQCFPAPLSHDVPSSFRDCTKPHCGRLIPVLRHAVQTGDARDLLLKSARAYFGKGGQSITGKEMAQALADLAVTGRSHYQSFIDFEPKKPSSLTWLEDGLREILMQELHPGHALQNPPFPQPKAEDIQWSVRQAVERAYQVAWAIRGPEQYRAEHRAALGWIAVSGEDDPPHRPVNVPSAPHPQYNMVVNVQGHSVNTRYMMASETNHDTRSVDLSTLPTDPTPPHINGDIILFIHGHSSRLEEALLLVPYLQRESKKDNRPLTVIAMDLPSTGYASMVEHTDVAPLKQSNWNSGYPVLEFFEEFVIAFVNRLEAKQSGISNQIVGVIGGSLGGNMTLRLAERNPPWLRNVVSWSPAGSWHSLANNADPRIGETTHAARERMELIEEDSSREKHFYEIGGQFHEGFGAQSDHWYSASWPCRTAAIDESRQYSEEVYNPRFRRWHWRVAFEQLIFSHWDADYRNPSSGPRYRNIKTRLLLGAGKEDNYWPEHLYDHAVKLSDAMTMINGEALFFANTGHSIHAERPSNFSWNIMNFLYQRPTPVQNNGPGKTPVTPKPLCSGGKKCCESSDDGKRCMRCIPDKLQC
jgi:pimeloyl-ACP methyl ester carboxylesterase